MAAPKHIGLTPGVVRDRVAAFLLEHPQFRNDFLIRPAEAIGRHLGLHIPDVTVVAIADTADTVHVVVPADPDELGDAMLERIAGGVTSDGGLGQVGGGWLSLGREPGL